MKKRNRTARIEDGAFKECGLIHHGYPACLAMKEGGLTLTSKGNLTWGYFGLKIRCQDKGNMRKAQLALARTGHRMVEHARGFPTSTFEQKNGKRLEKSQDEYTSSPEDKNSFVCIAARSAVVVPYALRTSLARASLGASITKSLGIPWSNAGAI